MINFCESGPRLVGPVLLEIAAAGVFGFPLSWRKHVMHLLATAATSSTTHCIRITMPSLLIFHVAEIQTSKTKV